MLEFIFGMGLLGLFMYGVRKAGFRACRWRSGASRCCLPLRRGRTAPCRCASTRPAFPRR